MQTAKRRGIFPAGILANQPICEGHYLLRLAVEDFPPSQPGQFIQLQCRDIDPQMSDRPVEWQPGRGPCLTQPELTNREPLLRRPLSLAGRRTRSDGTAELDIIYRAAGTGTRWLTDAPAGDTLSVMGPLGNAFAIRADKPAAALIGGGVGIPPMMYLAQALAAVGKKAVAFAGIRTGDLRPFTLVPGAAVAGRPAPSPCIAEFAVAGVPAVIASDDGTLGFKGLVGQAFGQWLDESGLSPGDLAVYCCGPEPLMRAVGQLCMARDIDCQLALERHMACGIGTCQSCVVKIRDGTDKGWSFKLCCADGPVFDARTVLW